MKKLLLLFVFVILLSSFVIAVSPFIGSPVFESGLTINVQPMDYISQNEPITFRAFVLNTSNGMNMANHSNCCFRVFYQNGTKLYNETNMNWSSCNGFFVSTLNESYTTKVGSYTYSVCCNSTDKGGYFSGSFEITASGLDEGNLDSSAGLALVIFLLFATSLFFLLPLIKKPLTRNAFSNLILTRGCWIIGIFLMSLNTAMIATIVAESFLPLTTELLYTYMFIFNWGGYLLMFFTFIMTMWDLVQLKNIKNNKERYGEDD